MSSGIRVLSLFDGMGGGRIALKELGIPVDTYYASEVDKFAIRQTKMNFPDIVHLGDVRGIEGASLGHIDLVLAGTPCFDGDTLILTKDGYKSIKNIKVGDFVYTHKKRYRKVIKTGCSFKESFCLKIQGQIDTIVTANHPYYARKKINKPAISKSGKRSYKVSLSNAEWIEAAKLNDGGYRCCFPIPDIKKNPLNITEDEAWIIGRYIADGHTRKDYRKSEGRPNDRQWQLILSIGRDKVDMFDSSIHHSLYKHTDNCYRAVFSSKRLVEIVEKHCGCGAENKFFSETLINLPKNILSKMLEGYLSGDGYYDKKKEVYSSTTISKLLAVTLPRVIAKVYGVSCQHHYHKVNPKGMIEGRVVNQHDIYTIKFKLNNKNRYSVNDGSFLWVNTKGFDHVGKRIVYNLEVEEDNSYSANNIIVHNCTNLSFVGNRAGLSTVEGEEILTLERYLELKELNFEFEGESFLFWEFVRLLHEVRTVNPNVYFMVENVEMGAKWENVFDSVLGLKGVHINSALVSAQNRRRIYWSNIRTCERGFWGDLHTDIPQPEDRHIYLRDVLEKDVDEKYYLSDKMLAWLSKHSEKRNIPVNILTDSDKSHCLTVSGLKMNLTTDYVCVAARGRGENNIPNLEPRDDGKTNCLTTVSKDNLVSDGRLRVLTPMEYARLQTVPDWYSWEGTSATQIRRMCGNGWTIEVIKHILSYLKEKIMVNLENLTEELRKTIEESYKELEEVFEGRGEVRGFTFTQLDQSDYAYLYEQKEKESGHITYEVFRRKVNTQFGCVSYPSSKGFGDSVFMGKTFRNLDKAKDYFAHLNKLAEEKACV